MKWYFQAFKKYAIFSGRATPKEYWMFILFNFIFTIAAVLLDLILKTDIKNDTGGSYNYGYFYLFYSMITLIPALAISVRRLHDIGKSGWWLLIIFIPFAALWLLYIFCKDGNAGENEYGLDPKADYNLDEPIDTL